jgi:ppGpp synthetase/RelA/SpoT-type nucleotidyltranferase
MNDENNIKDKFTKEYNKSNDLFVKAAKTYKNLIVNLLNSEVSKSSVEFRIKTLASSIEKLERKYLDDLKKDNSNIEKITDIIGIRVICLYESEIEKIENILSQEFDLVSKTDKTEELKKNNDTFGYKSLHLDLKLNSERIKLKEYEKYKDIAVEVQVRTIIQNAWSELDHQIKYKNHIPDELSRRINRLSALFEIADSEFEQIAKISTEYENQAKIDNTSETQENTQNKTKDELNIFSFLAVLNKVFDEDVYQSIPIESLLDEILDINSTITSDQLLTILNDNMTNIDNYIKSNTKFQNTSLLTKARQAIYLSDTKKYEKLLYPHVKEDLDEFMKKEKPIKKS